MIIRTYLLLGIVLLGGTGWFIVGSQPPTVQAVPVVAEVTRLQAAGVIPQGDIEENPEIEHGIFETPPEDEIHLQEAMQNMDMSGMAMGGDAAMDMNGNTSMDMAGSTEGAMDMSGGGSEGDGQGMAMTGSTGMTEAGDAGGMNMAGGTGMSMDLDTGEHGIDEEAAAQMMAQQMAGLIISDDGEFDREIELSMMEWTFSPLNVEVQKGERIKFTLRNDGTLLHEFMFMTMAEMQAITYRAKRADWSLFEHEALFEKALLLPGQEITFVAEVTKPGSWMFMCMLPYHMQMGMMGQLATPGAAMKM